MRKENFENLERSLDEVVGVCKLAKRFMGYYSNSPITYTPEQEASAMVKLESKLKNNLRDSASAIKVVLESTKVIGE